MFYGGAAGRLGKIRAPAPREEEAPRPLPVGPAPGPVGLDGVDEGLLAALHADGRASLGNQVEAMPWLTVAPSVPAGVGRALAGQAEVSFAAAVTGSANLVAATPRRSAGGGARGGDGPDAAPGRAAQL
ncbi:hypothetical protein IAG44_35710 [Streptomyces roseirectus]|uniref:Uncharacterized protein n=1 Tax=Streptomyces roseirectus TaxID=2768066 RepID=A0A7H0INB2_9ACTN|nr:hypothetical protein [Streptomyces roseirectus]QNP74278.1 hypothetical protein IAG44_35710 [Streptomyces roseirectus]